MGKNVAEAPMGGSRMESDGLWASGWLQAGILTAAVLAAVAVAMLVDF